MIEVRLKKSFNNFGIDVNFRAPENGITVLSGVSGSGKTTIINMIAGLVPPDSGYISVAERVFFDSDKKINCPIHKRRCGCIFQDGRLFPNMNVRKNLLYGSSGRTAHLDAIVELLGISRLLNRMPSKLSGGEKQRVSIGRALMMQPDILLMDEPLASLDSERKEELIRYIDRLPAQFNIPVFYVTHSRQEILRLADELIRIHNGRIESVGIHDGEYRGLGIQENDGEQISLFDCRLKTYDEELSTIQAEFHGGVFNIISEKRPEYENFMIAINASDTAVSLEKPENISISNIFKGTIIKIEKDEHGKMLIHGDIGSPIAAYISKSSCQRLGLEVNNEVYFLVKAASLVY